MKCTGILIVTIIFFILIFYVSTTLPSIDHNPSATSSRDSFHGTALSVTHVTRDNPGVPKEHPVREPWIQSKSVRPLPETYSDVPQALLPDNVIPPTADGQAIPKCTTIDEDELQIHWLTTAHDALTEVGDGDQVNMNISWSAYFANLQASVPKLPAIIALLPLFHNNVPSAAVVKHGMNIIKLVTNHVNPGQYSLLISLCMLLPRKSCGHGLMNMKKSTMLCCWVAFMSK